MTPKQCQQIWRDAALKLAFDAHGIKGDIFFNENKETPTFDAPVTINGLFNYSPFKLFTDKNFIETIFENSSSGVSFEKATENEAGIIFEHLFTEPLQLLEELIGEKITITSIEQSQEIIPENSLSLSIHLTDHKFNVVFINKDNKFLQKIAELLQPFQAPGEKNFSNRCDVIIGPIELPEEELKKIQPGDLISLGQKMGRDIDGFILRESGAFWHAGLEPSTAVIKSKKEHIKDLLKSMNNKILVGIKIGSIKIDAADVAKVKEDDKHQIERIGNNIAYLTVNGHHLATGSLQNVSDVLCLAVNKVERISSNG